MTSVILAFVLGLLVMYLLGKRPDFGVGARLERDAAVEALRELVSAAYRSKPGTQPTAREARAWARAVAVLSHHGPVHIAGQRNAR